MHGGFHAPRPKPNAAEINRIRRRLERYDAELAKLKDSKAPTARATRRALKRHKADLTALLETLEGGC